MVVPIKSLTAVINGPDETAGSWFSLWSTRGSTVPIVAAAVKAETMPMKTETDNCFTSGLLIFMRNPKVPEMTPQISPSKNPVRVSEKMIRAAFESEIVPKAIERTTKVEDCKPTLPAMAMMTGIKAARIAIFSTVATKSLEMTKATNSSKVSVIRIQEKRNRTRLNTESDTRLI